MTMDRQLHGPVYDFGALGFDAGEVLVVTGGAQGIGRAIATLAVRSGLSVALWDRDAETARIAAAEIGGDILAVTCDIGAADQVDAGWRATAARGPCRYLVNNAAPGGSQPGFDEHIATAVGGTNRVTEGWLASAGQAAASAVNMVSIVGTLNGGYTYPHYPTAKGAITALTRHLAVRHRGHPRFNAVAPGYTITPRVLPYIDQPDKRERLERAPVGRLAFPEEIAAAVLFLLSPAASFVNGALLPVDGGWTLA